SDIPPRMERPRDNSAAEPFRELRHFPADRARSNQSDDLSAQLRHLCARPLSVADLTIHLNELVRYSKHQHDRVLRNGDRGNAGSVAYADPEFLSGSQIDVVGSGSPDRDQLQIAATLENLARKGC